MIHFDVIITFLVIKEKERKEGIRESIIGIDLSYYKSRILGYHGIMNIFCYKCERETRKCVKTLSSYIFKQSKSV